MIALGLVVPGVDEGEAGRAVGGEGLEEGVVRHVGRDEGIGAGGEGLRQERRARPAAHGDGLDERVVVADVAQRGRVEPIRDAAQEVRQRLRRRERSDRAEPGPRRRLFGVVDVVRHFLVRVRLPERPHHTRHVPPRDLHFEPDFVGGFQRSRVCR